MGENKYCKNIGFDQLKWEALLSCHDSFEVYRNTVGIHHVCVSCPNEACIHQRSSLQRGALQSCRGKYKVYRGMAALGSF